MTKEQDTELEKLADDFMVKNWDTSAIHSLYNNQILRNLFMSGFIAGYKSAQERITSIETANAFHKKEAEDAVKEQNRLIKALRDIQNWDEEMEEKWGDPGCRAIEALKFKKDNVT